MMTTHSADDIARLAGGTLTGGPTLALKDVNSLELAGPDELSFISSPEHFKDGERSRAGCIIAPPGFSAAGKTIITTANPKLAFVKAMWVFHPSEQAAPGVHPTAVVDPSATLGAGVLIGPLASIGPRAAIGDAVRLGPSVAVGADVRIGPKTVIHPNATIYPGAVIGSGVIIHAGTVIGADGFGFVPEQDHHLKVPQLGTVVIEDDVEIGANCTIDRATFGATTIKRGTKFDNLVHIAHNVTVGSHSLFAAQVGIAGSSKIGSYVMMGGQSGVADNAVLGDHVAVGAKTAVITRQHIPAHQSVWGIPARPTDETKERLASVGLLPKLRKRLAETETRLHALEEALKQAK